MDKIAQKFMSGELTVITGEKCARPLLEWCSAQGLKWNNGTAALENFSVEIASALDAVGDPHSLSFCIHEGRLFFADACIAVERGDNVISYELCDGSFELSAKERFLSGNVAVRTGTRYVRKLFDFCAANGIGHSDDGSGAIGITVALEEVSCPINLAFIVKKGLLYWCDCAELKHTPVIEPVEWFKFCE